MNPRDRLDFFFWGHPKYQGKESDLLEQKAMALAVECPGCPVLWAVSALYQVDSGHDFRCPMNQYQFEWFRINGLEPRPCEGEAVMKLHRIPVKEPSEAQRARVAEEYGLSPAT